MQGKGLVKFFLVVLSIVTLWQLSLYIPAHRVEQAADEYAKQMAANVPQEEKHLVEKAARIKYLDSMSTEVVYKLPLLKSFTYQDLKSAQLALGLDLKGGMSVVLQVDLSDFIKTLAEDYKDDPVLNEALEKAKEAAKNSQEDFITLFLKAWKEVSNGRSLYSLFRLNETLQEELNPQMTDEEVAAVLRKEADGTVDRTYKLLKERIDRLGVIQPNISLDKSRDIIIVELPGVENPQRAREFLQGTAKLEFWEVYNFTDPGIQQAFVAANEKLRQLGVATTKDSTENEPKFRIDTTYVVDSLGNIDSSQYTIDTIDLSQNNPLAQQNGPLFDVLQPNQGQFSPATMGVAEKNKRDLVMEYLNRPEVRSLFKPDIKFAWSKDPMRNYDTGEETNLYQLYALKVPPSGTAPLEGDVIVDARPQPDPQTGKMSVSLTMNQEGAQTWGQMTTRAFSDNNRQIAITLDDRVISAPAVQSAILGGRTSITGNFSTQEARDLANMLEIGKLPARPVIIQESVVGPSLGQDNINRSIRALLIGFLLVLAFMVFYYNSAGVFSIIALFLNVFFIFGTLASMGTVLTLPGIAGIILTIGMAVDANVIIFERVREELRAGKALRAAVRDGFKYSYSAIIDANVTTLLTAAILAYYGLGPIKGFAVVLIVGVLYSLFTAVLVIRLLMDWWMEKKGRNISFWTKLTKGTLTKVNVDWLGKRKIAYVISGTLVLLSFISFFTRGFDLGIDFKGGHSYTVAFAKDVTADELRKELTTVFQDEPVVKAVNTQNTYNIVTSYLVDEDGPKVDEQVTTKLLEGINAVTGENITYEQFTDTEAEGTSHLISSSKVGAVIADDITRSSYKAGLGALLLIFLYIFIRFNKWQYSLGAVMALFHDSIITLGMFSMFHGIFPFSMEIDQAFIAAILTVIGYSINDTVVVFDRVREYIHSYIGGTRREMYNNAINSTLSRTVITSLTTLFVVFVLFVFGGGSIKGFAFALLVGIVVGTYSSIFVATPIMADFVGKLDEKVIDTRRKSSFAKAAR